jgi:SAM-dependent methyltransferase
VNARVQRVADYYRRMTAAYQRWGGDVMGWHMGLWEPEDATLQDAIRRTNDILIEGLDLRPGTRVLDSGCGMGGLAFYLAERFGVRVLGVTICREHVLLAGRIARERGLEGLVSFRQHDFMDLPTLGESFHVAVNLESVCYASNLHRYLQGVAKVLVPGGTYRTVDGFLGPAPQDPAMARIHRDVQVGWRIPPLRQGAQLLKILRELGFVDLLQEDHSQRAEPTGRHFIQEERQGLRELEALQEPTRDHELVRLHLRGMAAFGEGLLAGGFTYERLGGTKPNTCQASS